ncbi:TP53 regulating kinase and related kinases [Mytilus galloprovincialis]|uniref:non-specific serine/threonine protein kinase n=1 Tax=Mytilus galloprovincialis TaxID=29158 RepID=A0A8B6EDJ4_MYTGA|nr:TP53 regulating kinase and related kinases [Mytilus galloprovincialis]
MEDESRNSIATMPVLMKQGAEAKLYKSTFYGKPCIIKERFTKCYRHPSLDKSLTTHRIKSEVRALLRCRMNGICTPTVYFTNMENSSIYMEEIEDAQTVREYIQHVQANENSDTANNILKPLGVKVGEILGIMHSNNIVHGDLTTSNMLLRGNPAGLDVVIIDFGLSHFENFAEEKGVDLYVLERAILSTHPNTEDFFQTILDSYKKYNLKSSVEVVAKLDEVRLRGRKRTMVG